MKQKGPEKHFEHLDSSQQSSSQRRSTSIQAISEGPFSLLEKFATAVPTSTPRRRRRTVGSDDTPGVLPQLTPSPTLRNASSSLCCAHIVQRKKRRLGEASGDVALTLGPFQIELRNYSKAGGVYARLSVNGLPCRGTFYVAAGGSFLVVGRREAGMNQPFVFSGKDIKVCVSFFSTTMMDPLTLVNECVIVCHQKVL